MGKPVTINMCVCVKHFRSENYCIRGKEKNVYSYLQYRQKRGCYPRSTHNHTPELDTNCI